MKQLITKSDGTPTKSKVHAYQALDKLGIPRENLIEEAGQFYYETADSPIINTDKIAYKMLDDIKELKVKSDSVEFKSVTWETEVFDKNNERTKLFIPGTDVVATVLGKYPAGQGNPKSSFEINIDSENFKMSVDLLSKIFKVRG